MYFPVILSSGFLVNVYRVKRLLKLKGNSIVTPIHVKCHILELCGSVFSSLAYLSATVLAIYESVFFALLSLISLICEDIVRKNDRKSIF